MRLSDGNERAIEPRVRKRFEPSRFDWLPGPSEGAESPPDSRLLQRAARHLSLLHRTSEVLASARDVQELTEATLSALLDVTGGDRAAFLLRRRDPETGGIEVASSRTRTGHADGVVVSRTLVADVIDKGVSTFACDAVNDERFKQEAAIQDCVRAMMCVPLRTGDQVLGALYVDSITAPDRFTEEDLELLAALGNQTGVALHRVRLMGELDHLLIDTIRAIAATIDAKDGYTHRHSERVATLVRNIARELGLPPSEQRTAQLAALLHDLGKIAVPDSILNKPGDLTADESDEMKKHPLHGAQILANIQSAAVTAVLPGVQYHHERWDGSGYPEGLAGEDIPLLGRLLSVADFFDAVTSERPYRRAIGTDDAIDLLKQGAGVHFDPAVVQAAVRLHERGELLPTAWPDLRPPVGTGLAPQASAAE